MHRPALITPLALALLATACSAPPPPPPPPPPVTATLRVHNTSDECAAPVPFRVLLDGQLRGEIQPGDRLEVAIEVGEHRLRFVDADQAPDADAALLRDALDIGPEGLTTHFGCADPAFSKAREGWVEVQLKNLPHGCELGAHGHVTWRLDARWVAGLPLGGEATRWLPPGVHTLSVGLPGRRLSKTRVDIGPKQRSLVAGCDGAPQADGRLMPLTLAHRSGLPRACREPIMAYAAGQEIELSVGEAWTVLLPAGVHKVRFATSGGEPLGEELPVELVDEGKLVSRHGCPEAPPDTSLLLPAGR